MYNHLQSSLLNFPTLTTPAAVDAGSGTRIAMIVPAVVAAPAIFVIALSISFV